MTEKGIPKLLCELCSKDEEDAIQVLVLKTLDVYLQRGPQTEYVCLFNVVRSGVFTARSISHSLYSAWFERRDVHTVL